MSKFGPAQFGPDYVRAIAPYQAGKPIAEVAREFGLDEATIVKLAYNENPFGLPNRAAPRCSKPPPTWAATRTPTASN